MTTAAPPKASAVARVVPHPGGGYRPGAACYAAESAHHYTDIKCGARPQKRVADWAAENGGLPMFGEQVVDARHFIYHAESWRHFAHRYVRLSASQRSYYELIMENWPCHFYMDVEFEQYYNPDVQLAVVLQTLLDRLQLLFLDAYGLDMNARARIVLMDSSLGDKQSAHVVIRFPPENGMFVNNQNAGAFYRLLLARERSHHGANSPLWVRNDKSATLASDYEQCVRTQCALAERQGRPPPATPPWHENDHGFVCAADGNVYTKMRQFRVWMSAKAQADGSKPRRFLRTLDEIDNGVVEPLRADDLLDTLVCHVPEGAHVPQLFECKELSGVDAQSTTLSMWDHHKWHAPRTPGSSSLSLRGFDATNQSRDGILESGSATDARAAKRSRVALDDVIGSDDGAQLIAIIEEMAHEVHGTSLYASRMNSLNALTMTFQVAVESRECEISGTPDQPHVHRNNKTYYSINLRRETYVRMCFKHECRELAHHRRQEAYRSGGGRSTNPRERPIPAKYLPRIRAIVARMRTPPWTPRALLQWTDEPPDRAGCA